MRKSKKTLAILAIIAMVLMMIPVQAFADTAASNRLADADRVGTAIAIANNGWTTASTVIVAPADDANLVDALAVAPLAGQENAPILMTYKDGLDAKVAAEIAALKATKVIAVGALSDATVAQLQAISGVTVTTVKGADRFETAAKVAAMLTSPAGTFVVAYNGLADALSAASFAAANKYAILIADTNGALPASEAVVGSKTYTVGGQVAAITGATSFAGADRYATNDAVLKGLTYQYSKVYVANGETLVDALAGSALAAKTQSPIILANTTGATAAAGVNANLTASSQVIAFGGAAVVPDAVLGSVVYTAPAALTVQTASAVNLNSIKVVFAQPVDETAAETPGNYTLGGVDLTGADKFDLQSDKQTLMITLDVAKAQFATAIFKVKGNVVYSKDLLTTVPSSETTLTFSDVTVPTVKAVTTSGNKKVTVEFSEPVKMTAGYLAAAGTNYQIDGQNIVNLGFTVPAVPVSQTTVNGYVTKLDLNFASALTAGNHTLTVSAGSSTDLIDAAGFKVAKATSDFTVGTATGVPSVVSVTGQNNGTVYVTYDREMDANATTTTKYTFDGSFADVTAASFKSGTNSTVVKLTAGTVVKGANVLQITKDVKDVYGNQLDPDNDLRIAFTASDDTVKPTVTSVTVITNTKVRVKFSENVSSSYATNVNNYTLKDSSGTTIAIAAGNIVAVPVGNSDTYEITTPTLTGSNYTLKIKNIVDLAATPNAIDEYTATFSGSDDVAPTVSSVMAGASGSTSKVAVVFSEAMDATTITNLDNYAYEDNKLAPADHVLPSGTTISAGADNKSVLITFPSAYTVNGAANTEYSVMKVRIANVRDVAGNILASIATPFTAVAAYGSGADHATYSAKTFKLTADSSSVTAQFDFNQAITNLSIADFTVAGQAPDTGYMTGKTVVLNFTTAAKITAIKAAGASAVLLTVAAPASTNVYGTPITPYTVALGTGITVYDDQIAPKLLGIADADGVGAANDTITLTFSENIDDTIAGLYTDDFTFERAGQLLDVKSATVAGANVTFNFDGATFAAGDAVKITIKAVSSKINIQDLEDAYGDQNKYVPATADTNGSKSVTP